jgi:NH3-dependent NAD+ synthetase
MEVLDEIVETTISADGTATAKKVTSDEEQLREFEMMELQEEFAENELRWRRKGDYKAAERANAPEARLVKWFMEGWEDRMLAAKAWGWYRLRLLYEHKAEA